MTLIRDLNGDVLLAEEYENWMASRPLDAPRAGSWIRNLAGEEYFTNIYTIGLYSSRVGDADLSRLAAFPGTFAHLRRLSLENTNLTDASLVHVRGLRHLRRLSLHGTGITDGGLQHLRDLPSLEVLNLGSTKISDRGLAHLCRLRTLQVLILDNTSDSEDPLGGR